MGPNGLFKQTSNFFKLVVRSSRNDWTATFLGNRNLVFFTTTMLSSVVKSEWGKATNNIITTTTTTTFSFKPKQRTKETVIPTKPNQTVSMHKKADEMK